MFSQLDRILQRKKESFLKHFTEECKGFIFKYLFYLFYENWVFYFHYIWKGFINPAFLSLASYNEILNEFDKVGQYVASLPFFFECWEKMRNKISRI